MNILVTGAKGQLGQDVVRELSAQGHCVIAVDIDDMDITDAESVTRTLTASHPDAVIHCAAWTAVDAAEDEDNRETVYAVNARGTENLAIACRQIGAKMLYVSTDYVFSGDGTRPWMPDDTPAPLNRYGDSKHQGELAVIANLEDYFIVRISWVFGMRGNNFVKTMLRLGETRTALTVVHDQIGSPTYTPDLAKLFAEMIQSTAYGIYHATNDGFCSWYDFACAIFAQASEHNPQYAQVHVSPVSGDAYPAKAKRPSNSRMDKAKLTQNGFTPLPTWQDALKRFIDDLMGISRTPHKTRKDIM